MDDDELHWRIADAMADSPRWVPEMAWHATGHRDARDEGHREYFLQHGVEDGVWRAEWMTVSPPRARLGAVPLKRVLRSRKYRVVTRLPGPERARLFERTTRRPRTALKELRWIIENACWRGHAPSSVLISLPPPEANPSPLKSFRLVSDALRRIGAHPHVADYVRRTSVAKGSKRDFIEHNLLVNASLRGSFGWPVIEEVTCGLSTELPSGTSDPSHPLLALISRRLHELGFHGNWSWNRKTRRFGGTFHGPQRPLHDYYTPDSVFYGVGAELDALVG